MIRPRIRLSSSIESCNDKSDAVSSHNSKSLDISDRMKKLLTSPLTKRKSTSSFSKVFGAPIESLTCKSLSDECDDVIPFVLFRLCHFIEDSGGLFQEGLFRISGNAKLIEKLKNSFDNTGDAPLESEGDIASASALLKLFLRELPQPLISESAAFLDVIKDDSNDRRACITNFKKLVELLPNENYIILKYLIKFLAKVACHEEQNRMNSSSLGIVFGPNIFKVSDNYQGLKEQAITNQIVSYFITDYKEIFKIVDIEETRTSDKFVPLSVEIPPLDLSTKKEKPLFCDTSNVTFSFCRKRKENERRCPSRHRSSSEERPIENKERQLRKCSSQEEISDQAILKKISATSLSVDKLKTFKFECDVSPKPPEAKRRELDTSFLLKTDLKDDCKKKQANCQINEENKFQRYSATADEHCHNEQNNFIKNNTKENQNYTEFASSICNVKISSSSDRQFQPLLEITTSDNLESSFNDHPVSSATGFVNFASNTPNLDLKTLHHNAGTTEPLLSEHRYSWPYIHPAESESSGQSQNQVANETWQFLKKANSYEAPLSPSAYRGYLNHRSPHLDSTVPPSPPIEQEKIYSNDRFYDNHSVKILNKKIHALKKKLKQFEQDFEKENGYRPSLEQKMNSEIASPIIKELNKLRKDFKEFKEESHFIDAWDRNLTGMQQSFGTFETYSITVEKSTYKLKELVNEIKDVLSENRLLTNRPEDLEEMKTEQILEEKLLLQKELLRLENVYGRPTSKAERDIVRPVYDRYRSIKRIVAKLPPQKSISKDSIELQPILEGETMHFISPTHSKNEMTAEGKLNEDAKVGQAKKSQTIYSNYHEMPLSELKRQLHNSKQEKRNLRATLRDFERDFQKRMGRRVEKEDKNEMENVYNNYKHIKGKVRLLEALVSKHQSHRLSEIF